MPAVKVLEFYSGIGGMHFALCESFPMCEIVGAFDINTSANAVYEHNFPSTRLLQKNIEGLTVAYIEKFEANLWTMSPPCQPYTRLGKQKAAKDSRARSFTRLTEILQQMNRPPEYIFLENVKGFEESDSYVKFARVVASRKYNVQSFLLCPRDFGVPNSRLRFYMLARLHAFPFSTSLLQTSEGCPSQNCVCATLKKNLSTCCQLNIDSLTTKCQRNGELLTDSILLRYHNLLDIVYKDSRQSCCFTKAYGKFIEGAGSVFTSKSRDLVKKIFEGLIRCSVDDEKLELLKQLELRFFSPNEIAVLMCFPNTFTFPINTTTKQQYKLLGNSINVYVVSMLMKWFLFA